MQALPPPVSLPMSSELKYDGQTLLLDKQNLSKLSLTKLPASVKSIEKVGDLRPGLITQANQAPVIPAPAPQTQDSIEQLGYFESKLTDMLSKFVTSNTASTSGSGTLPGNTITNPKEDLKVARVPGMRTQVPESNKTSSSSPKVMNRDNEVTKDTMLPTNNGSTEDVQPPIVQVQSQNLTSEPVVDPVSASMPDQRTSILFPSRRNDERRREKANDQIEKFYEIFRDLSFEISFTDALTLMP
ncbi:hypothetical protein Tco_1053247, partial [Tanacetum coccineum]